MLRVPDRRFVQSPILEEFKGREESMEVSSTLHPTCHSVPSIAIVLFVLVIQAFSHSAYAQLWGTFTNVRNLGPNINSSGHEPGIDISDDGLTMLLYSDRDDGFGDQDIWISTRNSIDEEFGPVENLGPGVNTSSYEGGPHISADGRTLYFNSSRRGGFGGQDLYIATRTTPDDPFGNVVNLGEGINTRSREAGPYFSADESTLYFQSNRPGSLGYTDIHMATRDSLDAAFGNVVNMGDLINSSGTENRGSISSDGLVLFFPSNRPGGIGIDNPNVGRFSDIYVATRTSTTEPFSKLMILKEPISSPSWEVGPTISPDWPAPGSKLYFSGYTDTLAVAREEGGYGMWDIFEATWVPCEFRAGDANRDSEFNQLDLVQVLQAGKYLTGESAPWEHGDWNRDGVFDQLDVIEAAQTSSYLQGPYGEVCDPITGPPVTLALIDGANASVPEPPTLGLATLALVGLLSVGWRKRR